MEHVVWTSRPELSGPVVLAAFEGWNDAGDAASVAAKWLARQWDAEPFAAIDPEEFYDFTVTRPQVRLDEEMSREIVWPGNEFFAGRVPGTDVDVIVLLGMEPQLRWRTFCRQITDVAADFGARLCITLGALLADVPHSRPISLVGTAYDPEVVERLGLVQSNYQGPTGIVGALHDACRQVDMPSASLWAAVPTYVPSAPSPKAALALVQRTAELLAVPVHTTDLEIAAAAYERQLNEVVGDDEETSSYVARLEEAYDADQTGEGDAESLVEEVERFLRDHPPRD